MVINSDSRLLFMQYNISDSQALFWCFILIILRMASLNTWLFMFSMPDFVLSFVLILFGQNLGFCSHKSALIKNRVYIHQVKRQLFSEFFSFRKSIPPTVWVERKRSHFVHQNKSLWTSYCTVRNSSRNIWILRQSYLWWQWVTEALKRCHKETNFDMEKFLDLALVFTNLQKL